MAHELITAFVLGLVGGVIPGPVLTAIFTEILQFGLLKSFRIIAIALFTETIVALASLLIMISLQFPEAVFMAITFIGAGILIWISTSIWKVKTLNAGKKVHFGFWKITLMILANGILWTFWITICIPKAIFLGEEIRFGEYLFLASVETGWLLSTTFVAFIFSRFRKFLSRPNTIPIVFKVFAFAFLYFAIEMIYKGVIFFTGG